FLPADLDLADPLALRPSKGPSSSGRLRPGPLAQRLDVAGGILLGCLRPAGVRRPALGIGDPRTGALLADRTTAIPALRDAFLVGSEKNRALADRSSLRRRAGDGLRVRGHRLGH